jgi:DNA-binding protein H-NS
MRDQSLAGLTVEELWALYEKVSSVLEAKMIAEQRVLEGRLAALRTSSVDTHHDQTPVRRPYPMVRPKFRNPENPSQTWAGRGKQPHWFATQVGAGRPISDLRIQQAAD